MLTRPAEPLSVLERRPRADASHQPVPAQSQASLLLLPHGPQSHKLKLLALSGLPRLEGGSGQEGNNEPMFSSGDKGPLKGPWP